MVQLCWTTAWGFLKTLNGESSLAPQFESISPWGFTSANSSVGISHCLDQDGVKAQWGDTKEAEKVDPAPFKVTCPLSHLVMGKQGLTMGHELWAQLCLNDFQLVEVRLRWMCNEDS